MPLSNFPTALDSWTPVVDGTTEVLADHVNKLQESSANIQTRLGIVGSAVNTTIEYMLRNASSVDPGHHHTAASIDSVNPTAIQWTGLTSGHALFATGATTFSFRQIAESDIADGDIFPRRAANETIAGAWTFAGPPTIRGGVIVEKIGAPGVGFRLNPSDSAAALRTYTWPADWPETTGYVLSSTTLGVLSWVAQSGALPSGSSQATLRHDGASWVSDTFLRNSGTAVGVNQSDFTGGLFHVKSTTATGAVRIESTSSGIGVRVIAASGAGVYASSAATAIQAEASGTGTGVDAISLSGFSGLFTQAGTLTGNTTSAALAASRTLALGGFNASGPILLINELVTGGTPTGPLLRAVVSTMTKFEIGRDGALCWFGSTSGTFKIKAGATPDGTEYTWPSTLSANKYLKVDGSGVLTWEDATGSGGSPGGSPTHVQYQNASNEFAGDADFTWTDTASSEQLTIAGRVRVTNNSVRVPFIGVGFASNSVEWIYGGALSTATGTDIPLVGIRTTASLPDTVFSTPASAVSAFRFTIGGTLTTVLAQIKEHDSTGHAELRLYEAGSPGNFIGITVPTISADTIYTLPSAYPAGNNYLLASSTAGALSWVAPIAAGSTHDTLRYTGSVYAPSSNLTNDGTNVQANGGTLYVRGVDSWGGKSGVISYDVTVSNPSGAVVIAAALPAVGVLYSVTAFVQTALGGVTAWDLGVREIGSGDTTGLTNVYGSGLTPGTGAKAVKAALIEGKTTLEVVLVAKSGETFNGNGVVHLTFHMLVPSAPTA